MKEKKEVVLVITGAVDTPEIGAGGTIIKLIQNGYEVYEVCLSYGELGQVEKSVSVNLARQREQEQMKAAEVIGVKDVIFFDWGDLRVEPTMGHKIKIAELIRRFKPEVIITNSVRSRHPGLRNASLIVRDAAFFANRVRFETEYPAHTIKMIYEFALHGWCDFFKPDIYVDISDVIKQKKEALKEHKSMWSLPGRNFESWATNHLGINRVWGWDSGVEYAEGFMCYWLPVWKKRAVSCLPL